jgi:ubiquinone/menaquinone biosynthesis C-methylase UbiE
LPTQTSLLPRSASEKGEIGNVSDVQRNQAYIVAGVDEAEVERLIGLARILESHARDGFVRAGLQRGQKAIDVGCGALGALPLLAELVGPDGLVLGVDMDATSLQQARRLLDAIGHQRVQLLHGNLNQLPLPAICPPGPFDVAFCRLVLMHQADPVAAVRRMAGMLRPGGRLIAHEVLFPVQLPQFEPDFPVFQTTWDWFNEAYRQRAVAGLHSARQYHAFCEQLGLIEVSQRGFFSVTAGNAGPMLRLQRANVVMMRPHLLERQIASEEEVEVALRQLAAAEAWNFAAFFFVPFVELIAQVPA